MEIVQQFNAELSSLYEVRPPISKAKMSQITRVSMKAVKMYKHIVQSVERFIVKCRPEYKIPGLYVIDSIVRQSRHQFGVDKDVYAARFSRNFPQTFQNLFLTCPPDDKPKIVRVLNLWQRNSVFAAETIQPLLDMANPNASLAQMKFESDSPVRENRESNLNTKDQNIILQLQQLANTLGLVKSGNSSSANFADAQQMESQSTVKFNKKLLDFDYGDEEDEEERGETPTEAEPPMRGGIVDDNNVTNPLALSMAQNLLSNPELLQHLQQMQKTIQQTELLKMSISELESQTLTNDTNQNAIQSALSGQQFLSAFQSQHSQPLIIHENNDESNQKRNELIKSYDNQMDSKHPIDNNNININESSFQYLQNANFAQQSRANELNFAPNSVALDVQQYHHQQQQYHQQYHQEMNERSGSVSPRVRSPRRSRFNRYRERSRSRSPRGRRDRDRDSRRSYRSRSRSPQNVRNSRFEQSARGNERARSPSSYERERERERRRRGLPPIRKGYLTMCSTTLWLGHVPKLASEADLSDAFGEFGTITSIDLIPPRGCAYVCMNRRQDASKALSVMKNMKLHGSTIKMAWAPGKGMKGKEFKDYWEVELGGSYIPHSKLADDVDLDLLEEGGMIDDDTVPEKLQELRKIKTKEREMKEREAAEALMARAAATLIPLVPIPNNFGGLVMPPNMLMPPNVTNAVMSVPSSTDLPSVSNTVTNTFAQPLTTTIVKSNDQNERTERKEAKSELSLTNESKNETVKQSTTALLPPPIPPFQPPPLGIPPPAIITGQPPPPMPWLSAPPPPILGGAQLQGLLSSAATSSNNTTTTITHSFRPENVSIHTSKPDERPPLIATLPLPLPHSNDELPPRLHSDREFANRDHFRSNIDIDRSSHTDDPFAPSVYELRAMERNSLLRPPIPHHIHSGPTGLRPNMPPNMSERFAFDNRPQRQFHPRQQHNMRSNFQNYDRHGNPRNNRVGGRDHFSGGRDHYGGGGRGNFNRRDRPPRWKHDDRDRPYNRNNDFNYNKQQTNQQQQQQSDNNVEDMNFVMINDESVNVDDDNNNNSNNNNNNSFDDSDSNFANKSDFNSSNNVDNSDDAEQYIESTISDSQNSSTIT